ncbi:hypothetical protein B296_00032403 [Ensete ventricosum]|uniref:Uncharacterized protein n=1 Tax=Ensete ventricosum TaxID=4639 RepID=A0A426ZYB5_ENSVE|nr:hypothetical protein B296_00032403 [Ensete ventricosum]
MEQELVVENQEAWSSSEPLAAPPSAPSSGQLPLGLCRHNPDQPHASGQRCAVREPRQRPDHVDHDDEDVRQQRHGSSGGGRHQGLNGDARRLGERAPRVAHGGGALGGQQQEVSDQRGAHE